MNPRERGLWPGAFSPRPAQLSSVQHPSLLLEDGWPLAPPWSLKVQTSMAVGSQKYEPPRLRGGHRLQESQVLKCALKEEVRGADGRVLLAVWAPRPTVSGMWRRTGKDPFTRGAQGPVSPAWHELPSACLLESQQPPPPSAPVGGSSM